MDVVIIGAGFAGLTAGWDLQKAGCGSFAVLEARGRVGGRVCNLDLGAGVISEGGGEWLSPGQPALADLARELEIETFDTYDQGRPVYLKGGEAVADGTRHNLKGGSADLAANLKALARDVRSEAPWEAADAEALDRRTLADFVDEQRLTPFERFTYERSVLLNSGVTTHDLSLLQSLRTVKSRGALGDRMQAIKDDAPEKRFVGGSHSLCARIAEALGDKVQLASPVRKIVGWDSDVVEIHTDAGVTRARQVIVAISPALCEKIVFDPPLPAGRAELQRLWPTTSAMRKTVHVYARPFWRDAGLSGQIWPDDGPLLWACDNSPPDGSLGVINSFVKRDLSTDPTIAERTISAIYAKAFGEAALHPIQFHDLDWGTVDEWSLACTSPHGPGFLTQWGKYLLPPAGRLIWSGTETADIWAQFMEGAVRSGHRAALQALGELTRG
jgi:monoamine oxidase